MNAFLSIATRVPVTYKTPQMPMQATILGAVLHTTNHTAGAGTIERFQADWQNKQAQSAHFMVERGGRIGQFRALNEVAWHINAQSTSYIGIEHVANPGQYLEPAQIHASADLLSALRQELRFPLQALTGPGAAGVGIHKQFASTGCGAGVFSTGAGFGSTFTSILDAAILTGAGRSAWAPGPGATCSAAPATSNVRSSQWAPPRRRPVEGRTCRASTA